MPPQWGSIETITTNVRQEQFSLCTGFYNFVIEVWIEPTHLFGKLAIASLAAWFNIYNDWSQIVFLHWRIRRCDGWGNRKWEGISLAIKLNGF